MLSAARFEMMAYLYIHARMQYHGRYLGTNGLLAVEWSIRPVIKGQLKLNLIDQQEKPLLGVTLRLHLP